MRFPCIRGSERQEIEKSKMMLSAAAAALRLEAGVASVPHPAKAQTGGEDAHLLLPAPRPGDHVVGAYGVFDGVGGWASVGGAHE